MNKGNFSKDEKLADRESREGKESTIGFKVWIFGLEEDAEIECSFQINNKVTEALFCNEDGLRFCAYGDQSIFKVNKGVDFYIYSTGRDTIFSSASRNIWDPDKNNLRRRMSGVFR